KIDGILIQTTEEYFQLKEFGIDKNLMLSPSPLSNDEIDFWVSKEVKINLSSFEEVDYFSSKYPNLPINFRLDLTSSSDQRTAIKKYQLGEVARLLRERNIFINSLHTYPGTNSTLRELMSYQKKAIKVYKKYFPTAKEINLGGGFSFDYTGTDRAKKHFQWDKYFSNLSYLLGKYGVSSELKLIFEPGRDIFADAGKFIISAKRIVNQGRLVNVSTDGSYVYMPSAKLKKRTHQVSFYDNQFTELVEKKNRSVISGSTTLSSDYVVPGIIMAPDLKAGDFIVIHDIGAYGATEHLEFLNKKPCPEVLIRTSREIELITNRGDDTDRIRLMLKTPRFII
ncbi:MAG: hypothetical protein WC387_00955, partial [Candidatus Paceibacterota bacterium]